MAAVKHSSVPALDRNEPPKGYVPPSADELAELARSLESAKTQPIVYLGSFAEYADGEIDDDE